MFISHMCTSGLSISSQKTLTTAGQLASLLVPRLPAALLPVVTAAVAAFSAMYDPLVNIRGLMQYFAPFYIACNVLLAVLCAMQWVWFSAVMR
jgi:Na+/H+-dicarboxylate symporter